MSTANLEVLSFHLMNSATAVYFFAFLAFAWDFVSSPRFEAVAARRTERASVTAGAPAEPSEPARRSGRATADVPADAPRSKAAGIAIALTVLGFGLQLLAVVSRGISAGRVPWGNMYEFSTAAALAVVGIYLLLLKRFHLAWLGVFVIGAVLLTMGLAVTVLYVPGSEGLVPALHSYWLAIHVTAAIVSAGIFTVGAAATALYLVVDHVERRVAAGQEPGRLGFVVTRVPPAEEIDRVAFRVTAFAFPIWTFAVVAGAIWAEDAWGSYWTWDPKETWAFITWVAYACYLHARLTAGWKGRRAAVIALIGFSCFLFNYFGVNILIPGLHSYSGL